MWKEVIEQGSFLAARAKRRLINHAHFNMKNRIAYDSHQMLFIDRQCGQDLLRMQDHSCGLRRLIKTMPPHSISFHWAYAGLMRIPSEPVLAFLPFSLFSLGGSGCGFSFLTVFLTSPCGIYVLLILFVSMLYNNLNFLAVSRISVAGSSVMGRIDLQLCI